MKSLSLELKEFCKNQLDLFYSVCAHSKEKDYKREVMVLSANLIFKFEDSRKFQLNYKRITEQSCEASMKMLWILLQVERATENTMKTTTKTIIKTAQMDQELKPIMKLKLDTSDYFGGLRRPLESDNFKLLSFPRLRNSRNLIPIQTPPSENISFIEKCSSKDSAYISDENDSIWTAEELIQQPVKVFINVKVDFKSMGSD